jgi:hypothetical protein
MDQGSDAQDADARRLRRNLPDYIQPHLGALAVGEVDTATVRQWRTKLLDGGLSANRAAKF